jgi:hypothetical protein
MLQKYSLNIAISITNLTDSNDSNNLINFCWNAECRNQPTHRGIIITLKCTKLEATLAPRQLK